MRAACLVFAILVACALNVQAEAVNLRFSSPAQLGGDVAVSATWVLLVFDANSSANLTFQMPNAAQLENITMVGSSHSGWLIESPPAMLPIETETGVEPFSAAIQFEGPGSLYLEAERVDIGAANSKAQLKSLDHEWCINDIVPFQLRDDYEARYDELCPPAPNAHVLIGPDSHATGFNLKANNVSLIEWHQANLACSRCPTGGQRDAYPVTVAGQTLTTHVFQFERLQTSKAAMDGSGTSSWLIAGGLTIDLQLDGWARLPLADGTTCDSCAAIKDQTLRLEGAMQLAGVRPASKGVMAAQATGAIAAAFIDEQRVTPDQLFGWAAPAPAIVATTAVGLGILWLFSRLRNADALTHEQRRKLFELIQLQPGLNLRDLARTTGGSLTTVRYHVAVLRRGGFIVERSHGRSKRLFENHGRYGPEWRGIALLRDPSNRQLHGWLSSHPGAQRSELVQQARLWQWSRRTAYDRIDRLLHGGVIIALPDGGLFAMTASPLTEKAP